MYIVCCSLLESIVKTKGGALPNAPSTLDCSTLCRCNFTLLQNVDLVNIERLHGQTYNFLCDSSDCSDGERNF